MLTIEHLALSYLLPTGKELPALQDFNLTINPGQMLGLVGESGCGKTTLCHVLTKVHFPRPQEHGPAPYEFGALGLSSA